VVCLLEAWLYCPEVKEPLFPEGMELGSKEENTFGKQVITYNALPLFLES
jgi:hypothetical protein